MKSNILVIGSAHLDIIAKYDNNTNYNCINKVGILKFAMGGAAYNIAANLSVHDFECGLLTVIKKDSITANWLLQNLRKLNIQSDIIVETDMPQEDGYVALIKNGQLITGITSSNIEKGDLNISIKQGIKKYNIIVIDCNLSEKQIQKVVQIASINKKPVFVQATSEIKLFKALYKSNDNYLRYKLFSMNAKEASVFFHNWKEIIEKNEIIDFCKACFSEIVIVTNGIHGYSIFNMNGERFDFKAVKIFGIISTLGAGDALLSGLIDHYISNNFSFHWDKVEVNVKKYVHAVLMREEASLG